MQWSLDTLTSYPFLSLVAKKEGQVEMEPSTLLAQDPPAFDLPWGGMITAPRLTDDSSFLSLAAPEALTLNMDLIPEKGTQEFRGKGLESDQQLWSVSPSSLVLSRESLEACPVSLLASEAFLHTSILLHLWGIRN